MAVEQLADASRLNSADVEPALLRRLPRAKQAEADAMIRLLGHYGTARSLAALAGAAREPSLRSPAIDAAPGADRRREGLVAAAFQSNSSAVRRAVITRLLGSGGRVRCGVAWPWRATLRLSRCVGRGGCVGVAAGSQLLAMLRDDEPSLRLPAAIMLGHLNGPQVTAGLIAIVTEDPARSRPRHGWRLLACRDESAARFLADAAPCIRGCWGM